MYFEEFEIGQKFQCEPLVIIEEEMDEFAKRYDPHPLHIDPEFAENTMFNGIIGSGFLTLSSAWGQWIRLGKLGDEFIVGKGIDYVRFTAPVKKNDVLTTEVEIVDLRPSSNQSRGTMIMKFTVTNQKGEVVLISEIPILIKTKAFSSLEQPAAL